MQNRTLIININTFTGEYINLNLPVEFVKRLIDNNCFDFFYYKAATFIRQIKTKSEHEKRKMVSSSFFRMILMRGSIYEELNRND